MNIKIIQGDCLDKLKELEDNSVDSIVTDPPAGISFMNKSWDTDKGGRDSWIKWMQEVATECKRVLKPGGHAFVWAIPRTSHWTATAWENAGFEIRDVVAHIFGSGFPKSLNIGKAVDKLQGNEREKTGVPQDGGIARWNNYRHGQYGNTETEITKGTSEYEGWGTALKPAREDWLLMRKPLAEKTVAENCLKWGTGGINIDASRVSAYIDGDNSENIVLSHKLFELRHKLHTLLFSCVADKKDCPTPASDVECVEMWKKLEDCLGDCSPYSRLYDELLPLFLKGDQVSVQQLHDVLGDIDRLRTEQNSSLSSQHTDPLSSLDDFYQLILSYLNDTTLYIKKQENTARKRAIVKDTSAPFGKGYEMGGNGSELGRFPANLITDGSEEVRECFPESNSGKGKASTYEKFGGQWGKGKQIRNEDYGDSGNASRFFKSIIYQAKASKSERNKGCEGLEEKETLYNQTGLKNNGDGTERPIGGMKNNHPTVKPIALMEYLIKMVTPKGGIVLDPFMGSGSTGVACKKNGYSFIGIDITPEYIEIAKARIDA